MGKAAAGSVVTKMKELIEQKEKLGLFLHLLLPNQTFKYLCEASGIDWSKVTVFHLDEYMGASIEDDYSFAKFIKDYVADKVNPGKVYYMNGKTRT